MFPCSRTGLFFVLPPCPVLSRKDSTNSPDHPWRRPVRNPEETLAALWPCPPAQVFPRARTTSCLATSAVTGSRDWRTLAMPFASVPPGKECAEATAASSQMARRPVGAGTAQAVRIDYGELSSYASCDDPSVFLSAPGR